MKKYLAGVLIASSVILGLVGITVVAEELTVPISENTLLDIKANANTVQVGWIQGADGRWWYRHADGSYTVNNWELIDGKWYFFDGDGWMKTGWIQWSGPEDGII